MGGKKRALNSTEDQVEDVQETVLSSEPKKKMKKDKKRKKPKREEGDGDVVQEEAGPSSAAAAPDSTTPMERRKKRKESDKERRRLASESNPQEAEAEGKKKMGVGHAEEVAAKGPLPQFHYQVINSLGSSDAAVREAAVEKMVEELEKIQTVYDELEDKSLIDEGFKLEAYKNDGLDQCSESVCYAVRRLIRGVSSSRECARQGFALGLTLVIRTIRSLRVDSLLKLIVSWLEINSSTKGQEQRECLLGRLFAYGALARSGRLLGEWVSDHNTSYIKEFTSVVISLAAKKRYLQDPAVSVLLDLIEQLPREAVLTHVLEAPGIADWFSGATEVGNPGALLLALKIYEKTSTESPVFGKLLPVPFCPNKLFSTEHLSTLATCLKESTFCQPRVHGVWPVLVNILLPETLLHAEDALSVPSSSKKHKKNRKSSSSEEEEISKNLQCFVEVIIEGSLLPSSHDRKHLAFHILLLLFPRLPASFVHIVLSYKLVQCLMDILSTKDSWLHKVGQHFLSTLSDWAKNDDAKKVAVIVALQKHSNGKFDSITRTKTVKGLMADFGTESGCMLFIQSLQDMFVDESHSSEEPSDQSQTTDDNSEMGSNEDKESVGALGNSDFLKTWIIESLPSILKCSKLDNEAKFCVQKEILKFLAIQGVFTASLGTEVTSFELQEKFRWPKGATSSSLCRVCIEQLQLLLSNAQKGDLSHPLPGSVERNDLGSYFMRFFSTLRNIPSISLFRPLEDEEENVLKNLETMETSLSKEERKSRASSDSNRLHSLRYLLIQLLLQILLRPREFSEAASELIICCRKAFPSSDSLESLGEDENDDDAPAVMDVLVDTLLSLLPQSSAPMRISIEQVFKYFCNEITDNGLLRMLRVIRKSLKPARHWVAESDNEDDEDGEDFLEIEEEEVINDKALESEEQTDDSEAIVGAEEKEGEASEDDDDDDDDDNDNDNDDESDGGIDDDAMFQMDTYLAQMFKERKNQAGSETAQFQLLQFKLRVLSLLEIYLHENPGKSQVLLVYSNLARTLVNPQTAESSEQLGQRIWVIIQRKIFKSKDYPKGKDIQSPVLESLLQKSLKLASKPIKKKNLAGKKQSASLNRQKIISSLARDSTFWILKIIDTQNFPEAEVEKIFELFRGVLADYFGSKKSQTKTEFLREIFRRRPWIGRGLFGFLLEKCASAKFDFRRVEALELVSEVIKQVGSAEGNGKEEDGLKDLLLRTSCELSKLVVALLTKKAEKQSRRSEVRKFCAKLFQTLDTVGLFKSLDQNARDLFEAEFGNLSSNVKK